MEEEYVRPRHCFEVGSTHKVEPILFPKPILQDGLMIKSSSDLDLKSADGGSDAYASDGESCASGRTDVSGLSSPSPSLILENAATPALGEKLMTALGIESDLLRETGVPIYDLHEIASVRKFVASRIDQGYETGSFLVTNLATVVAQLVQWRTELPMVQPFYAVKCNPDPVVLRLLASLGCSFDCATMGEIEMVLNGLGEKLSFSKRGIAASSIVYANPAKMPHMLDYAIQNGVRMTVFDGEDELYKIASLEGHENLQLLLRLTTDDRASICRFSKKFGCPVEESTKLLEVAKSLGLNVAGVSFHVGSGCGDPAAYSTAINHASFVFSEWERLGMPPMHIVDLGGGFPGDKGGYGGPGMPTFQDLAAAIRKAIEEFKAVYPHPSDNLVFIAEPGRYFVSASTTIATKVYSRKGGKNNYQALYVDDGVYGSFNNVVYDHATPVPLKLEVALSGQDAEVIPSAIFGPTCDGLDQMCSLDNTKLPRCDVGDWLIWENQGAYTHTASFVFNGYTHIPKKTYCYLEMN